jgi:hypothetical protein
MYNMPASAYRASTVPIGESGGNFINSEEQTLVGTAGAGFNLTMLVEAGLTENIGAYVSGENDGQYVGKVNLLIPFVLMFAHRSPLAPFTMGMPRPNWFSSMRILLEFQRTKSWSWSNATIFSLPGQMISMTTPFSIQMTKQLPSLLIPVSGEYAIAWSVQTAISDLGLNPNRYELGQNYPNPFNPSTTIRYSIARTSDVKLVIYNVLGQRVAVIANVKNQKPGTYEVDFNAREIASGMYFYRIEAGSYRATKKMILLK